MERIPAPPTFAKMVDAQRIIHEYEICQHLKEAFDSHWDQVSTTLKPVIERGRSIARATYEDAVRFATSTDDYFATFFKDYDAILSPSAAGEAPRIGPTTGDPIFCTLWTLAGLPAVSIPLLISANGLPIGVQLIGAKEEDGRPDAHGEVGCSRQ